MGVFGIALRLKQLASIATQAPGTTALFAKSDGGIYAKNGSTEYLLGNQDVRTYTSPLKASGAELREQFFTMSDGYPSTTAETRQAMINYGAVSANAVPYVRSGFMSTFTPNSAEGGAYRIAQLSGPVISCGARFAFSSYSLDGGILCLSIQNSDISSTPSVPVSPMHFWISPTGSWSLDVNDTAGTAVETIASGTLASPLVANGTTLYTVSIVLDRDRNKCHVFFPDGTMQTFVDSRFGLPGNWVYLEPFKTLTNASSKSNALVREWWADSRDISILNYADAISTLKYSSPISVGAWTAPTLAWSWVNFGAPHQDVQYRKVGDLVQIRGLMKNGTMAAPAFNLPAGYRPPKDLFFAVVSAGAPAVMNVEAGGNVYPSTGSNTWFAVNCEFSVST